MDQPTDTIPAEPAPATVPDQPPPAPAPDPLLTAVRQILPDFTMDALAKVARATTIIDDRGVKWEVGATVPFPKGTQLKVFQIFLDDEETTIYAAPGEVPEAPARYVLRGKALSYELFAGGEPFLAAIAEDIVALIGGDTEPDPDDENEDEDDAFEEVRTELRTSLEELKMLNEFAARADSQGKIFVEPIRIAAYNRALNVLADYHEEIKLDIEAREEPAETAGTEEPAEAN